jgi:uncharacterized coiled-coil DUF342 family protein
VQAVADLAARHSEAMRQAHAEMEALRAEQEAHWATERCSIQAKADSVQSELDAARAKLVEVTAGHTALLQQQEDERTQAQVWPGWRVSTRDDVLSVQIIHAHVAADKVGATLWG